MTTDDDDDRCWFGASLSACRRFVVVVIEEPEGSARVEINRDEAFRLAQTLMLMTGEMVR